MCFCVDKAINHRKNKKHKKKNIQVFHPEKSEPAVRGNKQTNVTKVGNNYHAFKYVQ